MKKILALLLAVIMCVSLCACGGSDSIKGAYVIKGDDAYRFVFSSEEEGDVWLTVDYMDLYADLYGTYEKTETGWEANFRKQDGFAAMTLEIVKDGRTIIVNGGGWEDQVFVKD